MKTIKLFSILLLTSILSNAQVSNYTFENSGGPFPYIGGSGAIITEHTVLDDYVSPSIVELPFNFNFGGTAYSSVGISENGFIWFGTASQDEVSIAGPISQDQAENVAGIISAFGIDLHPQTTGSSPTRLRSGTVGAAPNRTFVIEWYHTSRIETIDDLNGPDEIDFQIRLSESTNQVELAFGWMSLNPNYTSYVEAGLKTTGDDFINRTTAGASWISTAQGATRFHTCELNSMFRPAFGQSFTWNTTSLGVEDETFDNFAIYPVPAQSNIQVSGLGGIPAQYAIFDITGRAVKQGETNGDAIDVQALSSGTYIVRLNRSGEVATRKFIKS